MTNTNKRFFALNLTEADNLAFIDKCFRDGTTPAEVLEGFINDLVAGSESRGSDERMLAEEYYNRCGYSFSGNSETFMQWLLNNGIIADLMDEPEETEIADIYKEYISETEHPESLEEGMQGVRAYMKAREGGAWNE